MDRFNDEQKIIDDFSSEFLVECPKCDKMSRVAPSLNEEHIRLSCQHCGYIKNWCSIQPGTRIYTQDHTQWGKGIIGIGDSVDWCFHLPLWLKIPCCNHILWAYNYEHLKFIENFIGAKLRERTNDETYGWRNQSLSSRLPKWMKESKNREQVLKAIEKLKQKGL